MVWNTHLLATRNWFLSLASLTLSGGELMWTVSPLVSGSGQDKGNDKQNKKSKNLLTLSLYCRKSLLVYKTAASGFLISFTVYQSILC